MRYYILYNPMAGNSSAKEDAVKLAEKLDCSEVDYIDVTTNIDYSSFVPSLDKDDVLIVMGGDGTLNHFVNASSGVNIEQEILYCSGGTGNDFLRDLEKPEGCEPFSIKKYIERLPSVTVNGKTYKFINNVGFGIDGYCCEVGDKQKAANVKNINYTGIAVKGLLFHYKPTNATITVDGVEYKYKKVWLAPTMNGRYYGGGMMAAPEQDRMNPDGTLSVMLFYGKGRLSTLLAFPSIFKGEHVKKKNMVAIHTGKEITVTFDKPAPVQIDGETILGVTSYTAYAAARVPSEV